MSAPDTHIGSEGQSDDRPVFRFAPSPNGALHLGHAYSALVNDRMARAADGRFLIRIEDIDRTRCTPALEAAMLEDLRWLGLEWEEPPRRQSDHFDDYRAALDVLIGEDLAYPAFMSRGEVRAHVADAEVDGDLWPRDPDGAPHYPPLDRMRSVEEREEMMAERQPFAWRIDMARAVDLAGGGISWTETGAGPDGETGMIPARPDAWGDVVLARSDAPVSYHLAVTVDDALQGITDVVRGRDLFHATSVHRLLQVLLGLAAPRYHHHDLLLGHDGRKLSKSRGDTALSALREAGTTPADIRRMVGL